MIKKIKATLFEKIIFVFLIILASVTLGSYFVIKNKCLFVKNHNPENINFEKPENIVILNAPCGNVIIELYPNVSPKGVERFKTLIKSGLYDGVAFHRVIKLCISKMSLPHFTRRSYSFILASKFITNIIYSASSPNFS